MTGARVPVASRIRALGACLLLAPTMAWAAADPMRPSPAAEPVAAAPIASTPPRVAESPRNDAAWRLVSIRVDRGEQRWALIGDRWVKRGDPIDDWRITDIAAEEVRLARGGERRTLRLWPTPRPAAAVETTSKTHRP